MKNLTFQDLQMDVLVDMTPEDINNTNGGYSWAEFKQDCADAWNDVKASFSNGFSAGSAGADATR